MRGLIGKLLERRLCTASYLAKSFRKEKQLRVGDAAAEFHLHIRLDILAEAGSSAGRV